MQSSNEVKGEPVNLSQNENQVNQVNSEQPTETYTEVVEEKKPEGTVIVENIVPVKQKNKIELQPENKLPSPPKQPTPIVPELNTEIKSNTTSTEKKEPVEVPKKEEKIVTPPKEEKKIDEEPSYFVAVEEMPSPIGGLAGIQQRVVYPNLAKLAGIEGKVIVQAYVNENGTVTKVELIKGIGAGCDEVALDAVRQTKFKPGLQRGKPVKVKVTIPIVFKKN
ncbi:MAG: TonB family protein [Ignavibacteriales bacterium]|nr:MAG: TonB family protein [Ignavibacteriales bacterium]